jgi:hypothetical protein
MKLLAENISNGYYNQLGSLWNTVCGQHYRDKDKSWIIDVDDKEFNFLQCEQLINNSQPIGNKIITKINTKNGYHVITKPFDLRDFSQEYPDLSIHKNNPTILYIP